MNLPNYFSNSGLFVDRMPAGKFVNGKLCKLVFCKNIRKNGKIIYPKKAKAFRIWVPVNNAA